MCECRERAGREPKRNVGDMSSQQGYKHGKDGCQCDEHRRAPIGTGRCGGGIRSWRRFRRVLMTRGRREIDCCSRVQGGSGCARVGSDEVEILRRIVCRCRLSRPINIRVTRKTYGSGSSQCKPLKEAFRGTI